MVYYREARDISINPLYECGYSRVWYIGCPLAGTEGIQRGFPSVDKKDAPG